MQYIVGGRALNKTRGVHRLTELNQTTNTDIWFHGRHTVGAKVNRGEGNSPDRRIRSPSHG